MLKVKKILPVLALSVALIALGGCAASNDQASAPKAETTAAAPAPAPIKIGKVDAAAHGTKCFTVAFAAVQGDKIVAAYVDDYQFMPKADAQGVPNSDKEFGQQGYKDATQVLASKRVNADYYSEHMKEKAGATKRWDDNQNTIDQFAVGKTISELEDYLSSKSKDSEPADVVSGSTLADTYGYLTAILDAAKAAK